MVFICISDSGSLDVILCIRGNVKLGKETSSGGWACGEGSMSRARTQRGGSAGPAWCDSGWTETASGNTGENFRESKWYYAQDDCSGQAQDGFPTLTLEFRRKLVLLHQRGKQEGFQFCRHLLKQIMELQYPLPVLHVGTQHCPSAVTEAPCRHSTVNSGDGCGGPADPAIAL